MCVFLNQSHILASWCKGSICCVIEHFWNIWTFIPRIKGNEIIFTTNLLITSRLIKDLKQKRLYTQNSQENHLPDLYRDLSLESICKCCITATETKVLLKPWQSLREPLPRCSPSPAGCAGAQQHPQHRDTHHFTLLPQSQQRVRKPWEPQMGPTPTYPPPPHAFCLHVWMKR